MDLLPKTSKEFATKEYWNKFFKKRQQSFEWYGDYEDIKSLLLQYIKINDQILVIGCGNSTLSIDLYDDGYENNYNIDISEIVIEKMIKKYKQNGIAREKLRFECMDMLEMKFENEKFNIVLDKGTLDAVCSDNQVDIDKMFAEISRVMKYFGRYICISLLQENVLDKLLNWFVLNQQQQNWLCRIHRCQINSKRSNEQRDKDSVNFPVFLINCLKMKTKLPESYIELAMADNGKKFEKIKNISELRNTILTCQHMELLKYMIRNGKMINDENFNIELFDTENNNDECRYRIYFVQKSHSNKSNPKCSIFIVPQGREHEWLFATGKGRLDLLKQCNCDRLAVVMLSNHKHQYVDMDNIKNDLSIKLVDFFPATSEKILFLSIGNNDIGERKILWEGFSKFNGKMFVEDVSIDGSMYRRLVFSKNYNIIQSEAKLKSIIKKQSEQLICDKNFLACEHHEYIAAGLSLINQPLKNEYNLLMIGLGGGCLATFLANQIKLPNNIHLRITIIEIDPLLESIAKKYFNFAQNVGKNIQINVIIDDGLNYLKNDNNDVKYDFIIFDIDSKNLELGISCPPPEFIEHECLNNVKSKLNIDGFFILNLVARNEELKQQVYENLKNLFKNCFHYKLLNDLNEIIFTTNTEKLQWTQCHWNSSSRFDHMRKNCFYIDLLLEIYRKICAKIHYG